MKVRDEAIAQVTALVAGNAAAAATGGAVQLLYRMLYLPEDGMFKLMPDELKLGRYLPEEEDVDGVVQEDKTKRFMWEGQQYRVGDFVYLLATCAPCSSLDYPLARLQQHLCAHAHLLLECWRVPESRKLFVLLQRVCKRVESASCFADSTCSCYGRRPETFYKA